MFDHTTKKHTQIFYDSDDPVAEAETEANAKYFADFLPSDENTVEPMSDLYYPVIDKVDHVNAFDESPYNPANHHVVGLVTGSLYWYEVKRNARIRSRTQMCAHLSFFCLTDDFHTGDQLYATSCQRDQTEL